MASAARISSDRTINKACHALIRAGWSLRTTGKRPSIKSPCGQKMFSVPKIPKDSHSVKNWFGDLKRAGVEVPA